MAVLELILMFLLQFEGIRGEVLYLYHRAGDVAVLPCYRSTSNGPCSSFNWFYHKHVNSESQTVVQGGKVVQSSPGAARLSLNRKCSLIINNITAEDAGGYFCGNSYGYKYVYLNILTISASHVGPTEDLTLQCSLRRYWSHCSEKIRWVDETGSNLKGDDDGSCSSSLTVKHQKVRNRTFSCQFVKGNRVKIEASYTSVSAETTTFIFIIIGAVVGFLVLMVLVAAVVLMKIRRKTREDQNTNVQDPTHHDDEAGSSLIYASVQHFYPKASQEIKVREEEDLVTYSAVRTGVKTEEDMGPNSLYSRIKKPQETRN